MWIFYSGGLVMPASVDPRDEIAAPELTRNGEFTLQVRAREPQHLDNLIADYLEPMGIEHSKTQMTPGNDYNCRFYMRQEAFALVMAQMTLDIDYRKFKPSTEKKNKDGSLRYGRLARDYHGLLNSVWGTVASWRTPGGEWGPYFTPRERGYVGDEDWADESFIAPEPTPGRRKSRKSGKKV